MNTDFNRLSAPASQPATKRWRWLLFTLGLIGLITAALFWRGDQIQVQVVSLHPPQEATGISTRSQIEIRFDQPIALTDHGAELTLSPAVTGTLRSNGNSLIFTPVTGLTPNTFYTVTLAAGLRSQRGHRLAEPVRWQFQTGQLEILFTAPDAAGIEQLYRTAVELTVPISTSDATPIQLTQLPEGIWDFVVAPDGSRVVYAVLASDGSSQIWSMTPDQGTPEVLIDCDDAVCSGASWSPDGAFLAYSRRTSDEFAAGATSPPQLWLLNLATGEDGPVFADSQQLTFEPRWSSDGQYLSYLSPDLGGVGTLNLEDGSTQFYETATGEPGIWRPGTTQLLINFLRQVENQYVIHLFLIDAVEQTQWNLSGDFALVEDGSPAWSPDGSQIAFLRKELSGPGSTLGKQLWLMNSDGSNARALTTDPDSDHGQPVWSPDGRYLLFHKLALKGPNITLSAWVLDTVMGESWQITSPAQRPVWLP